jgi:hypothetical protein
MPPHLAVGRKRFGVDMQTEVEGEKAGRIMLRGEWNTAVFGGLEGCVVQGDGRVEKSEFVFQRDDGVFGC